MTIRRKSALLMVSLTIAAGVSAPAADALPSCQESGTTSTCRTNGSVCDQGSSRDSCGASAELSGNSVGAPPLVAPEKRVAAADRMSVPPRNA